MNEQRVASPQPKGLNNELARFAHTTDAPEIHWSEITIYLRIEEEKKKYTKKNKIHFLYKMYSKFFNSTVVG